jgi:hypothetical protein
MLMGLPYRDTQCGAKVLRRDVVDDVLPRLASRVASLLDRAASLDAQRPSYYGAAWVDLGRAMLVDHSLGRC